jgi:hypothetical protein
MTETNTARYAYVLGIDPGTTTGLALARFDAEERGRPHAVWGAQEAWDEAAASVETRLEGLRRLLDAGEASSVTAACERFTINAQTAQRGQGPAEDALGMVGVVRRNCLLTGVTFGPLEQASAAKRLIRDDVLRSNGLYAPGLTHVNDAYRHALLYAIKSKLMHASWLVLG